MPGQKWTKEAEEYLIKRYEDLTCEQIAEALGKTTRAVQHKFNKLELKRKQPTVGDRLHRLTIKTLYYRKEGTQNKTYAKCICDCGNKTDQRLTSIVQGKIKSCGCYHSDNQRQRAIQRNFQHGYSVDEHKRLFAIWLGIKYRCFDPKSPDYIKYGARGIRVSEEWLNYENFRDWSLANGHSKELTLDRLDSNYHYSPDNCRWATFEQQLESKYNNRQILAFGEVKSLLHWTKDPRCKNDIETVKKYLAEGKSPEDAMSA